MATCTDTTPAKAGEGTRTPKSVSTSDLDHAIFTAAASATLLSYVADTCLKENRFSDVVKAKVPHLNGYTIFVLAEDQAEALQMAFNVALNAMQDARLAWEGHCATQCKGEVA